MRTFLPTLFTIVYTLCLYIARHGATIRDNLPDQTMKDKFDTLSAACDAFIILKPILLPIGD
jgi:hypothetical protein